MKSNKNQIIVSVVMITYGHEKFIEEAIKGVLMQECDFEVELIIADDCSPDKTEEIVKNIIEEHANGSWIKYNRHIENLGPVGNGIWALDQAKGKYIALCEGDDYWTDPLKLQKQVDFLEANEDYSVCGAVAQCVRQTSDEREFFGNFIGTKKSTLKVEDFLSGYPIHTSTVLFREKMLHIPDWIVNITNADVCIFALLAEKGPVGFINEAVSVYRITDKGMWAGISLESRYYAFKNTVNYLNRHFKGVYKKMQYQWEFNEAQKVGQLLLKDQYYWQYVKFVLKNYYRYFWWFIWLPKQKKVINSISNGVNTYWVKFRMIVGLRICLKKFKSYFLK